MKQPHRNIFGRVVAGAVLSCLVAFSGCSAVADANPTKKTSFSPPSYTASAGDTIVIEDFAAIPVVNRFTHADEGIFIIEDLPAPLSTEAGTHVLKPMAAGNVVYSNSLGAIDASNTSEGYIMARYTGNVPKIKVQIKKSGGSTYTYNLRHDGGYEVFPLTAGNGSYTVNIYENISGNQYALALGSNVNVELRNSLLPFLYPNQYVNFNADSAVVKKSEELNKNITDELQIVSNVYNYVVNNITYDTYKAQTVQSGYLPAVDQILSSGKGICFDYAAVMASMLRAQQIPTRLEVGYVSGGAYHAWLSTYIQDIGWVNDIIYFDGSSWKLMDPTFASSANQSSSIMQYIGTGSNYSTYYYY